jgi:PEP-CTERM motif
MNKPKSWIASPWTALLITLAGGISMAGSARAQTVTGDTLLDNLNPTYTTLYPGWNAAPSVVTYGPGAFSVYGSDNGGSLYYDAVDAGQSQVLNPNDNQATLVLTINDGAGNPVSSSTVWIGIPFILNDNTGAQNYGGYAGEFGYNGTMSPGTATWNGNTVTETVPLNAAMLAAVQAGNDMIYGFNLEYYPAVMPAGLPFSTVTFDSLTLSQAVPEPSTLALLATGAGALWSLRRRK